MTLGKEASCLRLVGDRHPDPTVAALEDELYELGNKTMLGVMGFKSDTPVLDVHCEIAYAHTGGMPIGISELCHAVRRATARVYNDGRVEYRQDPQWFTPYQRRESVDWDPAETPYYARPDAGRVTVKTEHTTRTLIPLVDVSNLTPNPSARGAHRRGELDADAPAAGPLVGSSRTDSPSPRGRGGQGEGSREAGRRSASCFAPRPPRSSSPVG